MTFRKTLVASVLMMMLGVASAFAQQQTGEIFGKAADTSGAVLPGATVTVSGPSLIQPRVAVTSETGTYRIPELPIGSYTVTVELTGFRTVSIQDIRVTIGFRAQVNAAMELSTVQETVTVTGASPLVDTREVGTKASFDLETLQNIPSARDPWVMLEKTPGIVMDRANVGGNQSGQQSGYISRGASTGNNKWSIDGVDITDMAATGASRSYFNFDNFEEIQVSTAGNDIKSRTGGMGLNLVVKRGTNKFSGSIRGYYDDENLESDNVPDELRSRGVTHETSDHNKQISDYGFDLGGPILRQGMVLWQLLDPGCAPGPTCRRAGRSHAAQESDGQDQLAGDQEGHGQLPLFRRPEDQGWPQPRRERHPVRRADGDVSPGQRLHGLPAARALEGR